MTIVVTGATGMIGRHLVAALRASGKRVRVLSRSAAEPDLAEETRSLPAPEAPAGLFEEALAGATGIVHCAALNSDAGRTARDVFAANAVLTGKLGRAAARTVPGRFIFLSSTRAMIDGWETATLDEATACRPVSAYGRSKLEGERLLRAAYEAAGRSGDATALRLPPVYGVGMRGQLGALLRLADTPMPLPFRRYGAPGTLVSRSTAVRAALLLLDHAGPLQDIYLAGDRQSLDTGEILASFRQGLARAERLFHLPEAVLRFAAALALQGAAARLLAAGQIVRSDRLAALGWHREDDTHAALRALAAAARRPGRAGQTS